jgi:hypothetical protein
MRVITAAFIENDGSLGDKAVSEPVTLVIGGGLVCS